MDVTSCIAGTNADLLRMVRELYIEDDDVIVDATFGQGGFWRRLPELEVVAHDLKLDGVDLRALPEDDGSVDVLALDPPYRLDESQAGGAELGEFLDRYGLNDDVGLTNDAAGVDELIALYAGGIAEAARVLAPRGRAFVKCQDFVHGRGLVLMADRCIDLARQVDLEVLDLFVLLAGTGPGSGRWRTQQRARRSHSYLLVLARSRYWRHRAPREVLRPVAGTLFG